MEFSPLKGEIMKKIRMAVMVSLMLLVGSSMVMAADYGWMRDMSAQALLDPSGFRARLAARFQIGDAISAPF